MLLLEWQSQAKIVNFAGTCMDSNPSQLISPLLVPSEKHWNHDDIEYANFVCLMVTMVTRRVFVGLWRDV
jgi:hypothetical protein